MDSGAKLGQYSKQLTTKYDRSTNQSEQTPAVNHCKVSLAHPSVYQLQTEHLLFPRNGKGGLLIYRERKRIRESAKEHGERPKSKSRKQSNGS